MFRPVVFILIVLGLHELVIYAEKFIKIEWFLLFYHFGHLPFDHIHSELLLVDRLITGPLIKLGRLEGVNNVCVEVIVLSPHFLGSESGDAHSPKILVAQQVATAQDFVLIFVV